VGAGTSGLVFDDSGERTSVLSEEATLSRSKSIGQSGGWVVYQGAWNNRFRFNVCVTG
jgi:hypothetical protein